MPEAGAVGESGRAAVALCRTVLIRSFSPPAMEKWRRHAPDPPIPGSSPPENLADSIVRLVVQPDGSLKATDFFSMNDDEVVDVHDWDLAGAPVALPREFSSPKYPHLLVATGKEGVVYLLDRDNLGGVGEGPGGTDLALGEYGPNGETISTAGAWPGNGGYVYISTLQSARQGAAGEVDVYKFRRIA